MTYLDVVRKIWGPCSNEEANSLLWGATAYPFADLKYTVAQLRRARRMASSISEAIAIACRELDEAMERFHQQEKEKAGVV